MPSHQGLIIEGYSPTVYEPVGHPAWKMSPCEFSALRAKNVKLFRLPTQTLGTYNQRSGPFFFCGGSPRIKQYALRHLNNGSHHKSRTVLVISCKFPIRLAGRKRPGPMPDLSSTRRSLDLGNMNQ